MEKETKKDNRFYTKFLTFVKKNKWLIIIFIIAVLLRLVLLSVNVHNAPDFANAIKGDDGYFEYSRNIADGNGFTYKEGDVYLPTTLRPPLYPYFLATLISIYDSYPFVIFIQIIIGSLIPVLAMLVARKYILRDSIVITIGFLLAIEPYSMLMSVIFYTETLFTFLFLIFIIFLFSYIKKQSWRNLIITSVFLALAVLVKPTVQYLPILFPLLVMWQTKRYFSKEVILKSLVFVGIFIILISPWLYRNYRVFGKIDMSAQQAFNLYVYFAPSVRAIEFKTGFAKELNAFTTERGVDVNNITLANSSYYTKEALTEIVRYPFSVIKILCVSVITFFTHDGMLTVFGYADIRPSVAITSPVWKILLDNPREFTLKLWEISRSPFIMIPIIRIIWILNLIAMLIGIFKLLKDKKFNVYYTIILLFILYFAGTTTINGLGVNARFRLPILIGIFSFSVVGFLYIFEYLKKKIVSIKLSKFFK